MNDNNFSNYVNNPKKETFVRGVITDNKGNTTIHCYDLVQGNFNIHVHLNKYTFEVQRGDTLIVKKNEDGTYKIVSNKTLEDEQVAWGNQALRKFTEAQRAQLLQLRNNEKAIAL